MVFIRKHLRKGKAYFSVVETFRENTSVRQRILHYIGSESEYAQFLKSATQADQMLSAELENLLYQTPVTLWNLMGQMGLGPIFGKHLSKKWGVDATIAAQVMILNYATDRYTKNTLSDWYEQTWLPHLLGVPANKMNKDMLCRTMDLFTEEKIREIQAEIYKEVSGKFKLSEDILFYDITDVTFEGDSCPIAKHGYNSRHTYLPQVLSLIHI